jgi:predicted amidophosphoribosyltransferase
MREHEHNANSRSGLSAGPSDRTLAVTDDGVENPANHEKVRGGTTSPTHQAADSKGSGSRIFPSPTLVCQIANGGRGPYHLFLATSTAHFAVVDSGGRVEIFRSGCPRIVPASEAIAFWSCVNDSDARPAGVITVLQCADNTLDALDVRGQSSLVTLDCSGNRLSELDLTGLTALENLYCDGNPLSGLDLSPCPRLSFLRHASRCLGCSGPHRRDWPFFFCPPRDAGLRDATNDTLCARKYISPRIRPLTLEEIEIRSTAYALKHAEPDAIAVAAPAMAALIDGPCWLVPIPASDTSTDANLALARAIAELVPGAKVKLALARERAVESSTNRRRRGRVGLRPDEHHFVRAAGPMNALPLYFVDNVITTGNTIRAARAALGWGTGLAYADASSPFNNRLRQAAALRPAPRKSAPAPELAALATA